MWLRTEKGYNVPCGSQPAYRVRILSANGANLNICVSCGSTKEGFAAETSGPDSTMRVQSGLLANHPGTGAGDGTNPPGLSHRRRSVFVSPALQCGEREPHGDESRRDDARQKQCADQNVVKALRASVRPQLVETEGKIKSYPMSQFPR